MFNFYAKKSRWLKAVPLAIAMSLAGTLWSFAQATYYSKAAATNFTDVNSWGANTDGSGAAPGSISNADNFVIQNGSIMNLNSGSASVRTLVVNAGSLTVSSNTLTVSLAGTDICTSNLTVNTGGTLTVSGGNVIVNGQFQVLGTGTLVQSGGLISVDGNGNAVAGNSVAGSIVNFTSNALTLSGGTLRIVDPHQGTGLAFQLNNATSVGIVATGNHVVEIGDGVSTQAGGSATNGFRFDTWTGSARIHFNDMTVNGPVGTNRFVTSVYTFGINRNLLVNAGGETRIGTITLGGNLTNNGTVTTVTTLGFGLSSGTSSPSGPATAAQTVSGTGVFRNSATTPTANFTSLTVNNTNASGVTFANANSVLSGANTGTVSGTLTFTNGIINTSGNTFILGISATSAGTLSWTAGGFPSGTTFRRWLTTTTLTTSTAPSFATTTHRAFPFVVNGQNRMVLMTKSATWTTGGWIEATHTNAAGLATVSIVDGAYTVERISNATWSFASGGGINLGATTLGLGLGGDGIVVTSAAPGTAPRLTQAAGALGTHAAGSGTSAAPFAARSGLSLGNLTGSTHNVGIALADLGFYSVANGPWESGATWSTGSVPTATDNPLVAAGTTVTVNGAAAFGQNVTVSGTLNITGNTLTVGGSAAATGLTIGASGTVNVSGTGNLVVGIAGNVTNNRTLTSAGTLNVSGGTVNIYGNLAITAGTFAQSGGNIVVDGNAGGVPGNSVAASTAIVNFGTATYNATGGTLTIVDPHANATQSNAFAYNGTANVALGLGHTIRLGDGVSTDAGGNATIGFGVEPYVGSARMLLGNVQLSTVTTAGNRYITGQYTGQVIQVNNLTVDAGSEWRHPVLSVAGNLVNNGTVTTTTSLAMAYSTLSTGTYAASTVAQSLGGSGVYRNSLTPTGNAVLFRVQNSSLGGVTLNIPFLITGQFVLGQGVLNTTATNILTQQTTTTNNFAAGAVNTWVNGPMRGVLPASFTNFTQWFPVGKTTENWAVIFNATTTAGGPVTLQFETNDVVNAPNTVDPSLLSLVPGREWVTSIVSGAANLTSTSVQAYDANMTATRVLAGIKSPATDFSALGANTFGAAAPPRPPYLALSSPIAGTAYPDRIAIGNTGPLNVLSVAVAQNTVPAVVTTAAVGSTDNNLARVAISAVGSSGTIALTDLTFTYTGTAPAGEVPAVTLWTGSFTAPTTQISSSVISGGTITFSGLNVNVPSGFTYLWVRFNTSAGATIGNTVDIKLNTGDAFGWNTTGGATANPPLPATDQDPAGIATIYYCVPTYSTGCAGGDNIANVNLVGSTVTLNNASGCTPTTFFTSYGAASVPDMEQGSSYTVNITMGTDATQWARVWVDFNHNGVFEATESFGAAASVGANGVSAITINVPPGATLGNTWMRIRGGDDAAITAAQACGASGSAWGEGEDYRVSIVSPTPKSIASITATQQTGGMGISTTNNNLLRVEVNVSGSAGTQTLDQIRFTYTGANVADIAASGVTFWSGTASAPSAQIGAAQNMGATVTFGSLATVLNPGANYFWLRVNTSATAVIGRVVDVSIASGDVTITASGGAISSPPYPAALVDPAGNRFIDYCAPTYSSGCGLNDQITNVTLNGFSANLNNSSACAATPFYTFFNAATQPDLLQGGTYAISITFGSHTTQWSGVWIDFNQNGILESTEYFAPVSAAGANGTSTFNITVPINAVLGNTRMRVRGGDDNALSATQACGATNSSFGETEDYIVTIIPPPNCSTVGSWAANTTTASNAGACFNASVSFNLINPLPIVSGMTFQLRRNGSNLGAASSALPITTAVTASGNYDIVVLCNGSPVLTAAAVAVTVYNPSVVSAPSATRCGVGTVTLNSTGSAGTTMRWYATATGGTALGQGPTPYAFVTPSLSAPSATPYYVEAVSVIGSVAGGPANPSPGTFGSSFTGTYQTFTATQSVTINSVDVFATAAGTAVIELRDNLNVTLASVSYNITAGQANSTASVIGTPITIPLNFSVAPGTGYQLYYVSGPTLLRNSAGMTGFYGPSYSGIVFTGNWVGSNAYWYNFYNLSIESSCASSPRTVATATASSPPGLFLNLSSTNICEGTSIGGTATGLGYTSYTWSPGALSGASQTLAPTSTTTYTVTATGGGCTNVVSGTVTVRKTPTTPTITSAVPAAGFCLGGTKALTASATTTGDIVLASENFNSGTLAGLGWTQTTTGVSPLNYSIVTAPYTYGTQISAFSVSPAPSSFVILNSDADINSDGSTSLISPSFSTVGRTAVNVNFTHVLRYLTGDVARLDYSTDNGVTWTPTTFSLTATTPAQTWTATSIAVQNASVALPAGALNQANVRVRFFYTYSYSYYWMIDDFSVTSPDAVRYRWSSTSPFAGIPLAAQSPATSNASMVATPTQGGTVTYTVDVTNSQGCAAIATASHTANVSDLQVGASNSGPQRVGTNLIIGSTATGGFGVLSYQWRKTAGFGSGPAVISSSPSFNTPSSVENNSGTYQVTVTDGNGCSANVTTEAIVYEALVWNGSVDTDWNTAANWTPNAVPKTPGACTTDPLLIDNVVIVNGPNQPVYPGAGIFVNNFGVESGQLTISNNVRVCGNLSGGIYTSGTVNGAGTVEIVGTGTTFVGGILTLDRLIINKTGAGPVRFSGTTRINDLMTVTSATGGINVESSGNVILTSSATQTGKIGPIPAGTSITVSSPGKFTQERYIPTGPGTGTWHFIGSPMTGKFFHDWADDFTVMGPSGAYFGAQGNGIYNMGTETERSTIFKYDQTAHNVYGDTVQKYGWKVPGAAETITNGQGYRVWVKYYGAQSAFDAQGLFHFGNKTFPTLSRNEFANCQSGATASTNVACTEGWRGWNLLANPYPCPINWDNAAAWTKPAQMNNAFYTWNAAAGTYQAYLGTTGTPGVSLGGSSPASGNTDPNVIPSSQAFFVKLNAAGTYTTTLSVTEAAKITTTNGQFVRTAVNADQVRIRMTKDAVSNYRYDGMIRFNDAATFGFDMNMDLDALSGDNFEFHLVGENNEELLLNSVPVPAESKVIPVRTQYAGNTGAFRFSFLEISSLSNGVSIYLKDNFLGTLTNVNDMPEYAFDVNNADGSNASDRFELVLVPSSVTGTAKLVNATGFGVYPNPSSSNGKVTLAVKGTQTGTASVVVVDMVGKEVFRSTMQVEAGEVSETTVDLGLASGVYTVKVLAGPKTYTEKLVVR